MATIDELRKDYELAEATLQGEAAEYDNEKARLKERYKPKLAELSERVRDAQKALGDAEALQAALERDDITPDVAVRIAGGLAPEAARELLAAKLGLS
jgi:3-keto-L-gulonate-6-phosphate decarboxylase